MNLALVHERDLEIKIDSADDQKKDHHDVRDRRVKVAPHFADEQRIEFPHVLPVKSMSTSKNNVLHSKSALSVRRLLAAC